MTNTLVSLISDANFPQIIMESAIRLCYCPLQRYPLNASKGLIAKASSSSSRLLLFHHHHHTLFNHASICASHSPTLNPAVAATRSSFPLANCTPNSEESAAAAAGDDGGNSSNNKVMRGVTGISVVLACVVGLMNLNSKMNPMFKRANAESMFPGGKDALGSMLETFGAPQLPKPDQTPPPSFRREPGDGGVKKIKLHAVGLSKSGDKYHNKAVNILKEAVDKYKTSSSATNLKLALVEVLIIQGKFEDARQQVDEAIDEFVHTYGEVKDYNKSTINEKLLSICDANKQATSQIAQMVLYKFITHTMLGDNEEAVKWLESFGKILENDE